MTKYMTLSQSMILTESVGDVSEARHGQEIEFRLSGIGNNNHQNDGYDMGAARFNSIAYDAN